MRKRVFSLAICLTVLQSPISSYAGQIDKHPITASEQIQFSHQESQTALSIQKIVAGKTRLRSRRTPWIKYAVYTTIGALVILTIVALSNNSQ